MIKKQTPRCLHKKDSVKNKLIIRIAKVIWIKSLFEKAFLIFKNNIRIKKNKPTIPKSAKF